MCQRKETEKSIRCDSEFWSIHYKNTVIVGLSTYCLSIMAHRVLTEKIVSALSTHSTHLRHPQLNPPARLEQSFSDTFRLLRQLYLSHLTSTVRKSIISCGFCFISTGKCLFGIEKSIPEDKLISWVTLNKTYTPLLLRTEEIMTDPRCEAMSNSWIKHSILMNRLDGFTIAFNDSSLNLIDLNAAVNNSLIQWSCWSDSQLNILLFGLAHFKMNKETEVKMFF